VEYIYAGLAMGVFVFLKAFQQKNVAFNHYWSVVPLSYLMAAAEVYIIASVAAAGFDPWLVLSVGSGAGVGSLTGMWVHTRIHGQGKRR
jgi:hypothetical protein